jgi:hypothetical protein
MCNCSCYLGALGWFRTGLPITASVLASKPGAGLAYKRRDTLSRITSSAPIGAYCRVHEGQTGAVVSAGSLRFGRGFSLWLKSPDATTLDHESQMFKAAAFESYVPVSRPGHPICRQHLPRRHQFHRPSFTPCLRAPKRKEPWGWGAACPGLPTCRRPSFPCGGSAGQKIDYPTLYQNYTAGGA